MVGIVARGYRYLVMSTQTAACCAIDSRFLTLSAFEKLRRV
jgi:hypothetical protein